MTAAPSKPKPNAKPNTQPNAQPAEIGAGPRKTLIGKVVSNKMRKTIVVAVESKITHPLYKKVVKRTKKFKVHDEKNECQIGDRVEIAETRPLSRDKYFRLLRIIEKVK